MNLFIIEAKMEEEFSGALPQLLVYLSSPPFANPIDSNSEVIYSFMAWHLMDFVGYSLPSRIKG